MLLSALLLSTASLRAQGGGANAGPTICRNEIPVGVKIIRLPEAEQHKVTISDFSVSPSTEAATYDLAMRIKNGTENWCITSFALTYLLGDARGQEWHANEYPTVMEFKAPPDSSASLKRQQIHACR